MEELGGEAEELRELRELLRIERLSTVKLKVENESLQVCSKT